MCVSSNKSSAGEEYAIEKYDGVVEVLDMSKGLVQGSRPRYMSYKTSGGED